MLKHLFTSKARVKLLQLFLLHPGKEYFVRELTRELNEQINSVRRELDNLKTAGLLKSRSKNRRKFYTVNVNFLLYEELRSMFMKAGELTESLLKNIKKTGKLEFMLISGVFLGRTSPIDLLLAGDLNKEKLEAYLDTVQTSEPIKFSVLSSEDFKYRIKCQDQFILNILGDKENIIALNSIVESPL